MEAVIAYSIKDFFQLGSAAFLCFYIVRDSLRMAKWKIAVCTILFDFLFNLSDFIFPTEDYGFVTIPATALALGCGVLFYFRVSSQEKGKLLFILLLVGSYLFFTGCLGDLLCQLLNITIMTFNYRRTALHILGFAITVYPFIRFMDWLWIQIRSLQKPSWKRLCLIPLIFILMFRMNRAFFESILATVWAYIVISVMIIVCAFVTYWLLVDGLIKAANAARLEERLRGMDNQLLLQAERLSEVYRHEGEIKQLRHDMRHHFAALQVMLGEGDVRQARSYLQEYIDRVEELAAPAPSVCQNTAVDAVCRHYMALAGQQNIQTDVAAAIPNDIDIAHADLSVLLGNLWENALEACRRQSMGDRFIRLRARATGGGLMLSMANSFDGVVSESKDKDGNQVLLSLKRQGKEEGIGLASIYAVTRRYGGIADYKYDASSFDIKIMLYSEYGKASGQTDGT